MAKFSELGNDLYTGKRSFDIIGRRKLWYAIAGILILISVVGPFLRGGFVFGIEFSGGSQFSISQVSNASQQAGIDAVKSVEPAAVPLVTTLGQNGIRIQTDQLDDAASSQVRDALATAYSVQPSDVTINFIGPTWGQDITGQAIRGLLIFIALAAVFMAIYFRTWKIALSAMIALLHDLVITAGIYGITGFEITPAAVIGFLTILGYSLYDTVVVFDKIRENTSEWGDKATRTFGETVNLAVNQTLVRSINTSVVAMLPVASILVIGAFVLGAGTLRDISLALLIGIFVGTYSTIFIASPLYAQLREREPKVKKIDQRVVSQRANRDKSVVAPATAEQLSA
ncbi:protein translocase subunit SecF [Subtercola sp. Z020]|uniref:protein translocase subunit SecF n=1 Tax=Subtercola sp. Z020 TaxID=2080582 RepID=UPI000CE734DF|nr:protein translocase subunit SecF [Subtercola sp. Z020]PPF86271.1 protein translocase subunit SecF [Subtercola sp. Z020]